MKKIFIILLTLLIVYLGLILPFGNYNGIDVSHHNSMSWKHIAEDPNIEFCYVKATEGSVMHDPKCKEYVNAANQIGLHVGLYHYFRTGISAKRQLANFKRVYDSNITDLIPAIDVEDKGNIFNEEANMILGELIELFKKEYGVYPIIYFGSWNSIKTLPVTYKCKKWVRCVEYSDFVPNTTIKQVDVKYVGKNYVDLNYSSDVKSLILKR